MMKAACVTLTVLLFTAALRSDDKAKNQPSPAERLAALKKEQSDSDAAFRKAAEELQDTPEGQKKYDEIWQKFDKGQADRFMAAVDLAKAEPKSDLALSALEWVLTIPRAYYQPAGKTAMEMTTENHAANPKVGKIVAWVGYYTPHEGAETHAAAKALIQAVAEKNQDRTARAQAMMAIAWEAKRKFGAAEYRQTKDAEKLATDAEAAFQTIVKDYADCPRLMREGQRPLGEEAKSELFELQHLRIGKVAPEIDGEDLDGVAFKLSDYRGKVVVIDFWGDW